MVYLIYHDKRTDVTHCWRYVFDTEAQATSNALPEGLKYVLRNVEDLHRARIAPLVLKNLFEQATGKELRWKNRYQAEKKVYSAMAKLTKAEVKTAQAAVAPLSPNPDSVATAVAKENETAEEKAAREQREAEAAEAKRLELEAKEKAKADKAAKAEEKKKERAEAKARRDAANAERKARRDAEKAARASARLNGPVDVPHSAKIKFLKERSEFPTFKGNREKIVAELQDGQTVGEFIKAAAKAVPGAGVADVRIYLEKGMIQLEKAPEAPAAPATTESAPAAEAPAVEQPTV